MEFQYKGLHGRLEPVEVSREEIERNVQSLLRSDTSLADTPALHTQVAQSLRDYYCERAEADLQDTLIRQAAQTLDYEPTEEAVAQAAQQQLAELTAQLSVRNLTLEAYLQFSSTSREQLVADMEADARQVLKVRAAIARIAALEGVEAEEEELAAALADTCRRSGVTAQQLTDAYGDDLPAILHESVVQRKVLRLVRELAQVEEVPLRKN